MKYVFVGDIHGKLDKVKEALGKEGHIVFVGDFIDSYDKTISEHDECYRLVVEAIREGKATALYGNHELSYLAVAGEQVPHHRCSGYDYKRGIIMRKYESDIRELFKPYLMPTPSMLVSHAGLTEHIWNQEELTIDLLPSVLASWWPDRASPMHWIGHYRGGRDVVGGLFWCDFNTEFKPIPELTQVFGHTRGHGIRQMDNSYCIDCLDFTENNFLQMDID